MDDQSSQEKSQTAHQDVPSFFDRLRRHYSGGPEEDARLGEAESQHEHAGADEVLPAAEPPIAESSMAMPPAARRALVSLLRQGVVLAGNKAKIFQAICRYETPIRQHLADVYLQLVLDEKNGMAFVASLPEEEVDEDDEPVSLITRRTLSLYDTLLLLVLRKHYQERELAGEQQVMIDIERIESHLTPFLPLTNSSKSDRRKLKASLKRMVERRLLSTVRGSEDRYEITPIIRYVVNAAFLEQMLDEYHTLAAENAINLKQDEHHVHS